MADFTQMGPLSESAAFPYQWKTKISVMPMKQIINTNKNVQLQTQIKTNKKWNPNTLLSKYTLRYL